MSESTRPRVERPPNLRPIPLPESQVREIENIPEPPKTGERNGLRARIGATRDFSPEQQKVLFELLDDADLADDRAWKALEILNRRSFPGGEAGEAAPIDLNFTEIGRQTTRQTRTVETDDGEFRVTVADVISKEITLQNASGQEMVLKFTETLP